MSPSGPVHHGQELTRRELEVLGLLALGRDTAGIARDLCLSPHTVKTHIARILEKLGADTRAHAVALAYHRRILLVPAARDLAGTTTGSAGRVTSTAGNLGISHETTRRRTAA